MRRRAPAADAAGCAACWSSRRWRCRSCCLIGAGLFVRTLHNLVTPDAGFDTAHILSFAVDPGENGYDAIRAKQFMKTLVDRLQASPGVIAAGAATHGLLEGGSWNIGDDDRGPSGGCSGDAVSR